MRFIYRRPIQYWVKTLQEIIGPTHKWPNQLRDLILRSRHVNNQQRFIIIVFMMCNGVQPMVVRDFFGERFDLDKAAWRQIDWVINKYPTSRWTAWNVAMGKSM